MKKSAYEYFTDDVKALDRFVRTIVDDVLRRNLDEFVEEHAAFLKARPDIKQDIYTKLFDEPMEELKLALMNPTEYDFDNIRFCSQCGRPFEEGYNLDLEYFCSDHCLHKKYTQGQYLAMYAGLDYTDPQEVKKALKMTQEELDKASDENDSNCYWSTWEWIA